MTRKEIIENRIKKFNELPKEKQDNIIKWRLEMIQSMHTIVCSFNHEEAYESWICGWIPDACDEDDIQYCAEDYERFEETVQRFKSLIKNYGGGGFFGYGECVADEKSKDYWERKNSED